MIYNRQPLLLLLFLASVAFFQAPAQGPISGIITPGTATTPIKAVAGAAGDLTQVICNLTPSIDAKGTSTLNFYCTSNGVIQTSGVDKVFGSGVGFDAVNGQNAIRCSLIKGASQALDQWQIAANGTVAEGNF